MERDIINKKYVMLVLLEKVIFHLITENMKEIKDRLNVLASLRMLTLCNTHTHKEKVTF